MKQMRVAFFLLLAINAHGQQRPEELRGSREQRVKQNIKAGNMGLGQITSEQEISSMAADKLLVELTDAEYFLVDRGVMPVKKKRSGKKITLCSPKENKIYVLKFVVPYIQLLAQDFFLKFGKYLKITSGARSLEEEILMRTKGSCYYTPYAAEVDNPREESLHVRGNTIDVSRRVVSVIRGKQKEVAMSAKEIKWMRERLVADKLNGIEFETEPIEEKVCYHIVVFPKPVN